MTPAHRYPEEQWTPNVLKTWLVAVRCINCKRYWQQGHEPSFCPECGCPTFTKKRYFEEAPYE